MVRRTDICWHYSIDHFPMLVAEWYRTSSTDLRRLIRAVKGGRQIVQFDRSPDRVVKGLNNEWRVSYVVIGIDCTGGIPATAALAKIDTAVVQKRWPDPA